MGMSGHRSGIAAGHRRGFAVQSVMGALILTPILALGACASYANVPEPDAPASVTSPNRRHPKAVMTASLLRVLRMEPPGSARYAVALPGGMTQESWDEILAALGPGAEPATAGNTELPTYSIGRIWIRSGSAKVDVFRPVVELGRRGDGTFDRQAITVWLEGGIEPWRVVRTQRWEVGAFPRPYVEAAPGESAELVVPPEIENGATPVDDPTGGSELRDEAEDVAEEAAAAAESVPEAAPEPDPTPPEPDRDDGVIRIESVDRDG